jgi:hypothetical protein
MRMDQGTLGANCRICQRRKQRNELARSAVLPSAYFSVKNNRTTDQPNYRTCCVCCLLPRAPPGRSPGQRPVPALSWQLPVARREVKRLAPIRNSHEAQCPPETLGERPRLEVPGRIHGTYRDPWEFPCTGSHTGKYAADVVAFFSDRGELTSNPIWVIEGVKGGMT